MPDNTRIPIEISAITRMSNKGAARAWFARDSNNHPRFLIKEYLENLFGTDVKGKQRANEMLKEMVREGEAMEGIIFDRPPRNASVAVSQLTQKGKPRKFASQPGSVRSTGEITIPREKNPKSPRAQRVKEGYYRTIINPANSKTKIVQVFIADNGNRHGGEVLVTTSGKKVKGYWRTTGTTPI
jgi:hypothetical protein